MDVGFLKDLYEKDLFLICEGFDDWKEAVKTSVTPMINKGMVEEGYAEGIIKHVEKFGPYIFLAPHICMPHCKAYQYVKEPGVCFMKCNRAVIADPNEPEMGAELFFVIAAQEEGEHLDAIQRLADIFDDEELINSLLEAKSDEDFRKLFGID